MSRLETININQEYNARKNANFLSENRINYLPKLNQIQNSLRRIKINQIKIKIKNWIKNDINNSNSNYIINDNYNNID